MKGITTPIKNKTNIEAENLNSKTIANHNNAAKHHESAAKEHREAAKNHEAGNHDKAFESTVKAHGHNCLANDHYRELSKSSCNC